MMFIWIFPNSEIMYLSSFSVGSICMVMLIVRNIIVFHDLDKLTGSALHLFPLLQMWNIHWNIRGTQDRQNWGFMEIENINFNFEFVVNYYFYSLAIYGLWAL
mmetsp:Transcript_16612/g.14506  ORF Transcript_16612/g.14506 Transcript_16612/m.14506 type:complete len:103 (+) Transcript_16612:572-880(+)